MAGGEGEGGRHWRTECVYVNHPRKGLGILPSYTSITGLKRLFDPPPYSGAQSWDPREFRKINKTVQQYMHGEMRM